MKSFRSSRVLIAGFLLFWIVGCEPRAYSPIVANACGVPVKISVLFVGLSTPTTGELSPGIEFSQTRRGWKINEIKVQKPAGDWRVYKRSDLDLARSKRKVYYEVWIITEDGLTLGDRSDLRKMRAAQAK